MRVLAATLVALTVATPAGAISRYNAWTMSCGEAKSLIRSQGAVILRYRSARNPSLSLYDRFVSDGRFCQAGEQTEPASVATADTNSCPVRKCVQIEYDDFNIWLRH